MIFYYYVFCPRGFEDLLIIELNNLGATFIKQSKSSVSVKGDLALGYRICLCSRLASKVLLFINTIKASSTDELYKNTYDIDWDSHMDVHNSFAVNVTSKHSVITNSHFAMLKFKDAIVDKAQKIWGTRPNVEREKPDIRFHLHLENNNAILSIDFSGESLHKRGYRKESSIAPLKENLAVALLLRSRFQEIVETGGELVDLFCGTGTFLIEAAMILANIPPHLKRSYFGFFAWKKHDEELWQEVYQNSKENIDLSNLTSKNITGFDVNEKSIKIAQESIEYLELSDYIKIKQMNFKQVPPFLSHKGFVITNPPYGKRIRIKSSLEELYSDLGEVLLKNFLGFQVAILTMDQNLITSLKLRVKHRHEFFNGALPCFLLRFDIHAIKKDTLKYDEDNEFANRLRKNFKKFSKWAKKEDISCYRVYDLDLPNYAVMIDIYDKYVHIQEYTPPKTVDPNKARNRRKEIINYVPKILNINPEHVFFKKKKRQKGSSQYNKLSEKNEFIKIFENKNKFFVNLSDYLDTGLFLFHRKTRLLIKELAYKKHFLNLFSYTSTASVYANKGGALSTTSIDLSSTYCNWSKKNFELNNLKNYQNPIIRGDCLKEINKLSKLYGLIFIDPPTFSSSKSMEKIFDVQRDHVKLINMALNYLEKDGIIIFSNNFHRFKLENEKLKHIDIQEITDQILPFDFQRSRRKYKTFRIEKKH